MKVLIPLLVLVQCVQKILSGVLRPEVPDSVLPYRNNDQATGKYTFTFKMSNPVPSFPRITIDFPGIYPKLLNNVDDCQGTVEVKLINEKKTFTCTLLGNQFIFDLSTEWKELDSGNIVVEIFDIINPSSVASQSTGFFQIRTWSGIDIVIDSNLAFDAIAFAPPYTLFSSTSLVNDGSNIAGYTTNYILTFTTAFAYPKGSWFRMKYADGFSFENQVVCYITNIDVAFSNLPCYNDGSVLIMKNLLMDLPAGTYKIKMRNIINPKIATAASGTFLFESLKEGVNTVMEYTASIAGVSISPGTVTDVSVIGFPLVQNLFVDYTITYRPANSVPRGGMFNIKFPADFVGGIDTSCRVIYGLLPADDTGISCTTNGIRDIYIKNFQAFTPQYIQVKCFAYNPPVGGETANFQVKTFTTIAGAQVIDQNLQAGTVVISEIEKPNFMEIDFYKMHINCSFYQMCPINFRYFPYPNQTLAPAVSTASFSSINMQIPIWWLLMNQGWNSTYPECLFEAEPTASCHQHQHVISIITPLTQGYGACEPPVTINNVQVTPIPGKFPFRIWAFNTGSKYHGRNGYTAGWYKTPFEQDTYIMDIPVTGIAVLQTWTSSNDLGDFDNLLHLRSNVHPFLFAWSGTISVIITHVEDSLQDKAEWPRYAGQALITDNSFKEAACKLYQSGNPTGYLGSWWDSRDLRCMMKAGDYSVKDPTTIQVTGFDSNIDKGNYYEMFIPDMRYCLTVNRQCKILYTYTMTEDIAFPYRISQREQSLGVVNPAPATVQNTATMAAWSAPSRSSNRRCDASNINVYVRPDRQFYAGDYMMVKRNIDHWHMPFFRSTTYGLTLLNGGTTLYTGVWYPVLNFEKNQEYFIHRFTSNVALTGAATDYNIRINNAVTSPYPNNVAWLDVFLWPAHTKRTGGRLPSTAATALNDGLAMVNGLVKQDLYGAQPWTHTFWWQPSLVHFRSCMDVPDVGEILFDYQAANGPMNAPVPVSQNPLVCRVWTPIRFQKANNSEVSCTFDSTNNRWSIKSFWTIPKRTTFRVNWYYTYGASMSTLQLKGETYNISGNAASMMDYYSTNAVYFADASPVGQTKANMWNYLGHYEYEWELYEGGAGKFVFEIDTGDNMFWEPTEGYIFRFTISNTVQINNGRFECRYAEKDTLTGKFKHHYPSVECGLLTAGATTNTYYMKLHPNLKIFAGTRYQIFLDTRATDTYDGLTFTRYGIYSVNVESYQGGTKLKGGKQRYEVFGPRIPHFFVWSSNKIVGEKAFYSYYIDFINTQTITDSTPTLATYHNIFLYFDTVAPGGYPMSLGMGYPDQSQIPCNIIQGVPYWTNVNTAICTILYGYSNAPTKIKIEGFRTFSTRVFRIDIPVVQNPPTAGVVPRTWLKVFSTTGAGAAKTSTVIWEGHYYELNTTWNRNTTMYPYSANTITNLVTMPSVAQLENISGDLIFTFSTPQTLHGNDFVLIKFPIFWPTPWSIADPNYCRGFPLAQERCFSIRNDPQDAHYLYFQLSGALASGTVIRFTVPSSRAVMPISNTTTDVFTMFLYHDTRLIATQTYTTFPAPMFIPDPIVPTITCNPTSALQTTNTDYIVTFILPHDLLAKSEIRIDFVDYDLSTDFNCTSTTNSALTGSVSCSITPLPDTFVSVVGFNAILRGAKVEIKIPLLNRLPAIPATRMWRVRTYYLRGGYYYVSGDSGLVGHTAGCNVVALPAITNAPWPTWFHKFQRTRFNSYGPLVFYFESAYTLTASTVGDYIEITIPTSFQFQKAEKVGSWGMHYPYLWDFQVVGPNHQIRLWAPKTISIAANTRYMVNITTLNALNDVNGLLYPDQTTSQYIANIRVVKGGATVEQGDAKIFVFKPNFPKYEAKSYLINSNQKSAFSIQFTIATAFTYASNNLIMKLRIPTATYTYRQRVNLFADDAGTGLANGATINCQFTTPALTLMNTYCRFYRGSQDLGTPATVELYAGGAISLAITTTYSVTFDGFRHPNVGDDDKHVEPSLEFFSPAGVWTYTGIDYDYTIVEDATYIPLTLTAPTAPRWDSLTIGQTNIGVEMEFTSPVALNQYQPTNGLGWADYIILEFPVGYKVSYNTNTRAKLTAGTGFAASVDTTVEFATGNNWIIWRPNIATIAANTQYTIRFSNVDQAKSLPANSTFRMLIVQDREIKRIMSYPPITGFTATAILPTDITFDSVDMPTLAVPAQTIPRNKYQMWSLTFRHPGAAIPLGGSIQIVLPAGVFTNMDSHCYNQPTSNLVVAPSSDTIYCRWDTATNSYIITNFNVSPTSDTIRIYFYANSQFASPGLTTPITIKVFNDQARSYQLLEGTINTLPSNAKYGFDQLMFNNNQDELPDVVRAGESSEFDFELKLPTTYTAATVLTLTFGAGASVPAGSYVECFFNSIESKECGVTVASPLTITILSPHSPALTSGTQYKVLIRTRCSSSNQKGIIFSTAGTFTLTVSDGSSTVSVPYEVFKPNFNWIQPRVMHSNAGLNNAIAFRMQINVNVPANGRIRIKFPRSTHSGMYLLWNSLYNPGTTLTDKCAAVSPSDLVSTSGTTGFLNCVYQEDTNHIMFVISGFNAMVSSNQPELVIYDILNTATTIDNLVVDAIIQTEDNTGVILNQGVIFDVFAFLNNAAPTISSPGTSYGRTGNNLGQSGVTYTFPNVPFGVTGFGPNDQIVFEFSNSYYFSTLANAACAAGTYKSYGRYVVFKPNALITGNNNLCFGTLTNPTVADTSQVSVYLVSSRGYSTVIRYNTNAWTVPTVTVTATASSLLRNAGSKYRVTVDTAATIPAKGSIAFSFQTDFSIRGISVFSGFPADSVVTIVTSVPGFVIGVVTTPTVYSKAVNGVAVFDIYVQNPSNSRTLTVIGYQDYATSKILFSQAPSTSFTITTTSAPITTCYFAAAPTYSVNPSGSLALSVLTPAAVAVTFTATTKVGYDMVTSASGTAGCNGLPVYVLAPSTLTLSTIDLYHLTIRKTGMSLPNAVSVLGTAPTNFLAATGTFAVDFGNHDLADLGYGLINGSYVPCDLIVNTVSQEALCTLDFGTFYKSPGVLVKFYTNIPTLSVIQIVISKFFNPTAARNIEVRFRYFETYYGQRTDDLVSTVSMFTILDSTVTTATAALALAPAVAQGTVASTTFTLTASQNTYTGLIFGPGNLINDDGQADATLVSDSYQAAAFNVQTPIAGGAITVGGITMPSSATGASTWTVVVVDTVTKLVNHVKTFTGTSVSTCTPSVLTFTALTKNDQPGSADYNLRFNSPCDYPRTSVIKITLAAYITNPVVLSYSLVSGTITGSYSITFDSTSIYISGFDYVNSGLVEFNMKIYTPYFAAGAVTGVFQVLHNGNFIINSAASTARVTTLSTLSAVKFRDYVRYDKPVLINGNGYLSLLLKPVSAFAATDILYLVQPSATFASSTFYLRCKFSVVGQADESYLAESCNFDSVNKWFLIRMPRSTLLVNTKVYRLDIFYVSEQNFGFVYPSTSNDIIMTSRLTNSGITKDEFVATFTPYKAVPTATCFRNFVSNTALKNVFMFRFNPSMTIPSGGFVEFKFPGSVVSQGVVSASFDKLIGLSVYNNQAIQCKAYTVAGTTKTDVTASLITSCVVDYGGTGNIHRYATVKPILAAALNAGTVYQFDFFGINNPTTTDVLSHVRMFAGTGATRDYYQVFNDAYHLYTVTPAAAIVEASPALPAITPTTIQSLTNINLNINTAAATAITQDIVHIRLLYNLNMRNTQTTPVLSATNFETFDVTDATYGLAYFYTKTTQNTNFVLATSNFKTPTSAEPFVSAFQAQIVSRKVVAKTITYSNGANTFVAPPWTSVTVPPTFKTVRANDKAPMQASLTFSKILSKTGSVELYLKNMASLDNTCNEVTTIIGLTFKCEAVSTTALRISGLSRDIQVGETITINFRATSATAAPAGQVCARAFNDYPAVPTAQIMPVQTEVCDTLSYTANPGIVWFEARTPTMIRRIQARERGMMTHQFTAAPLVPMMNGKIRLLDLDGVFNNTETKDFLCFFTFKTDFVAKSCVYYAATKYWEIFAPRIRDLSGTFTLTVIPHRQQIQFPRVEGILMPTTGNTFYRLQLQGLSAANAVLFTAPELTVYIPAPHYTTFAFNSYLVMNDAFSTFHLKIVPSVAIPATPNGVIKIDFKVKDHYNLDIFAKDLGTGTLNGGAYSCPSATGGLVTNCRLYLGNANTPASILVDPSVTMAVGTSYAIDFPALLNPFLNMSEVLMEISSQQLVTGNWVNLNTKHHDVFVAQEIIVTPTLLPMLIFSDNRSGSPCTVTFTFTMNPASGPIKSSLISFDRIVIKVDKPVLDILNDQAVAGRQMACPGYNIKIFDSKDLIELSTTTGITAGSTVSITCTNFFNQQYVIRGGVSHTVELWIDGTIAEAFKYATNVINPHPVITRAVAISAITPEISSFDTYTFTVKPFNYMPVGSRFEIYFDQAFSGITNCEIISGLKGGICQILEDSGGFDHIKISMYQLWDPLVDPQIVIRADMISPPTAGTYPFNFQSIWLEDIAVPANEDLIDQDVLGSITYAGFTPFPYLALSKMYQWAGERCPDYYWEGVMSFQVALVENNHYPNYLMVDSWNWVNYQWWERSNVAPFVLGETLCYFDRDNVLFSAKSERCFWQNGPTGRNTLYMMIPEELPLLANNQYVIHVDSIGQWDRGFSNTNTPSYKYYSYMYASWNAGVSQAPSTSSAPFSYVLRACFFGTRDYTSTNWNQDHSHSLEVIDSTGISYLNLQGGNRYIPRFQAQFSTHNEIKAVSLAHLGWNYLTTENATDGTACNYWHDQTLLANPNAYDGSWDIACQVSNVNPSYADYLSRYAVLALYNFTTGNYGNQGFRYGYAQKKNYFVTDMVAPGYPNHVDGNRNTFAHVIIQSQTEYEDGTFLDNNRVVRWYHIGSIQPVVNDAAITQSSPAVSFRRNQFGNMHTTQSAWFDPLISLGGRIWVYWELEHPWWHLTRNLTHGSRYCRNANNSVDVFCNQYGIPARWSIWAYNGITNGNNLALLHFGLIESPGFALTGVAPSLSKIVTVYIAQESGVNYLRMIRTGPALVSERMPYYVFEMDDPDNPTNTQMVYRLGLWSVNTYENNTNVVRLWITNDFPTIGPDTTNCKVLFGFRRPNMNQLAPANSPLCKITLNDPSPLSPAPGGYHRVEFYNLYRYSRRWFDQYESWMIFEIKMLNPPTARWPASSGFTGFWNNQVWPAVNESRANYQIRIADDQGRSWVGNQSTTRAHYFRVVRNRLTFLERKQKQGEWAELHMRLYPKNTYPADISKVEIQIPQSYDIPNGGTKICEVGHDYHTDLEGQFCEISNERLIQVRTNQNFGLLQRCTIVRITTNNSVKNNNGFQAPASTAVEDFACNLYIGTTRIEYTAAAGTPEPSKLVSGSTLNISANVIEVTKESTLIISFKSDRAVRAGYDTEPLVTDVLKKSPQGIIIIRFNTRDSYTSGNNGFATDLGYTAPYNPGGGVPFDVPCHPFGNLKPKEGERITCTVYPQATINYYNPVELWITNFQFVSANQTNLEIHITRLSWILTTANLGWVEFSIYEKHGDGTMEKTYDDVRINLGAITNGGVTLTTFATVQPLNPVFVPNIVGARASLSILFSTQIPLYQSDVVEVLMPSMMILPKSSDISAVFKVVPANVAIPPYSISATVVVYDVLNRVNFILPRTRSIYGCTVALPCSVTISTAGFRNMPYEVSGNLAFTLRIVNKQGVVQWRSYQAVPPPVVSPFASVLVTSSSQFSEDVYATYQFSFSPSVDYPTSTTIQVILNGNGDPSANPTLFNHIDKSNPAATCATNFANITASCVISQSLITVVINSSLVEGYAGVITVRGMKNPTFVGTLSSKQMWIKAIHPVGLRINENTLNALTYKSKKNVDTIIYKMVLSSYYQQVSSEYRFVLQNTNTLPPKGTLNILLPKSWTANMKSRINVNLLIASFTTEKLIFKQSVIRQPSDDILLQIVPDFEWPSKQKLIVVLDSVVNPIGVTTTTAFQAFTQYDSVMIDQSDITDPASLVTLKTYDPKITVWKSDFSPRNEGELATYSFVVSCQVKVFSGQKLQFIFPSTYADTLTLDSLSIRCLSNYSISDCTASSRQLTIPLLSNVLADDQISITVQGITNPNYGSTNNVDVAILDSTDNVIQFINDAFYIESIQGATYTPLAKINSQKNQILVKSDYQYCLTITGSIPSGSTILLDFPKQFNMKKDSYKCYLGNGHDSSVLTYPADPANAVTCKTYPLLKRIEIYGQTNSFTYGGIPKMICYKIGELENAQDTGESFHFNMRVFDTVSKKILYKSAGNLNYPSTLFFTRTGLRIFVATIPDIPIGTMSNDITISLEKPVPYTVTLKPSSTNIEFIPEEVVFEPHEGQIQTFRISPSKTTAAVGTYAISWVKTENTTTERFSEMVDTFFRVTSKPDYRQLKLTVSQSVYRASVGAQSMPIYVTLSHPASTPMTLYFKTKKPFQPEFVKFSPESITFQPGEKVQMFSYKSMKGAVSGLIELQLQADFADIYYMSTPTINFEIEDVDSKPPSIEDYQITDLKMKSASLRVSCDESARVYYICSIKGTITPSPAELTNASLRLLSVNRPRTAEIQDSQFANITSQTKSFIYYDSYIQLANLTPNTEYTMFMMPQDLSGNNGNIKSITFKTAPVPPAVTFKLKSSAAISDDKLLQALSLVAGLTVDKIKITYKPIFSSIPTTEPEVDSVLKSKNMEYEIMITPDATIDGKTPYDYLKKIEDEKDTLFEELPSLDPTQSISATGKEMTYDTQKFAYKPKLIEVSNFHALFNISIFYSGTVYGIILPANEERPSAAQIKDGLTSVNRQVIDKYFTKASIQLQDDKNYQVQPSATMNFTFLYHSSKYVAYFIAERDTLGDPVLMKDSEVLDAPLTTLREIFRVEDSVVELNSHSTTITASWIFIGLLLLIQFIN